MRTAKPNGFAEIDQSLEKDIGRNVHELTRANAGFRLVENGDDEISSNHLGALLRRVAETSTREIETGTNRKMVHTPFFCPIVIASVPSSSED